MNMNNKNWVSVWGNAVSIAEHHPEAYAKYITLRYPVYIPFDGDTLRFTFDNYCGSENPSAFREGFDSGDHLHPSSKAYQAMAECAYEVLQR